MSFIAINGVVMKTPAECTWELADESSPESGRTLDGVMHKDIVAQKRTLKIKWGDCDWAEGAKLIQYCKNKGVQYSVTYPDPMTGRMETKHFYTGNCSAIYRIWCPGNMRFKSISCDFIEI